jgi:class 3 adenylate cyclase
VVETLDLALSRSMATATTCGFVFADLRAHGRARPAPADAGADLRVRFKGIVNGAARRFGALDLTPVGDGYYLVLPSPRAAVRCARAIAAEASRPPDGAEPLRVGVGVHSAAVDRVELGPLEGPGHLAARIGAVAPSGDVLVTAAVVEHLGRNSGLRYEPRTLPPLKGLSVSPAVYAAVGEAMPVASASRVVRLLAMGSLAGLLGLAVISSFGDRLPGVIDEPLAGGTGPAQTPGELVDPGPAGATGATDLEPGEVLPGASSMPTPSEPPLTPPIHIRLRFR